MANIITGFIIYSCLVYIYLKLIVDLGTTEATGNHFVVLDGIFCLSLFWWRMSIGVSLFNLVSAINMTAYHLRATEVEYELRIRNVSTEGKAADNRKKLSHCFRSNTEVVAACVNSLDAELEFEICHEKLQDLSSLVENYEGTFKDNEYQRIVARLWHLYSRVERIPLAASLDSDKEENKTDLLTRTRKLIDEFKGPDPTAPLGGNSNESELNKPDGPVVPNEMELKTSLGINEGNNLKPPPGSLPHNLGSREQFTFDKKIGSLTSNLDKGNNNSSEEDSCNLYKTGFVPVYKWGLQFSNSSGQSIGSFLQRVEELRRARGLTEVQLFKSAVDLFSGSALIWYRSTVGRITSWAELCQEMKEVFQTPDYDDMLSQEIMNRRQGDQETIDLYIASMEGLYSRLSMPTGEEIRLKQMLKNLNRYLQEKLCLFPIVSISQLRTLGRKAELGRLRAANSQSMSSSAPILEPDLAYRKSTVVKQRVAEVSHPRNPQKSSKMKCWNCSEEGHSQYSCSKPRTVFCYGCGAKNVKKTVCTFCCPKNARVGEPALK